MKPIRLLIPLMAACLMFIGISAAFAGSGPPGITGVSTSDVSTSTAVIAWTTATSSTSVVRYATSTSALASSTAAVTEVSDPATTTSHSIPLSGLMPETQYFYEVESATDTDTETDNDDGEYYDFTTDEVDGDGDNSGQRRKAFVGVISGFATATVGTTTVVTSVTLTKKGTGEPVTINLGADVRYKFPGGPKKSWGSLEEAIAGEAEFVILTRRTEDGNEALFVLAKPKSVIHKPYVGPVVEVDGGVLTILLPNGKTKKLKGPRSGDAPEVGDIVTAFVGPSEDGEGEEDGEPVPYTGLVGASKVAERIERFLDKLAARDNDLPEAALNARARLVADLAAVLDAHTSHQVDIVDNLSNTPLTPGLALGLQKAREKAKANKDKGKAIAEEARGKVGAPSGGPPVNIFGKGKPENANGSEGQEDETPGNQGPPSGGQGGNSGNQGNKGGKASPKGGPGE